MPNERESTPLSAIHLYLKDNPRLIVEGEDGTSISLNFYPHQLAQHLRLLLPEVQQPAKADEPKEEKNPTTVLTGRLLSNPRQGTPDKQNRPTAWAKFAAHVDEEDEAHLFIASFQKQTTQVALDILKKGSQMTARGYHHPSTIADRLDNFYIIHLINYSNK